MYKSNYTYKNLLQKLLLSIDKKNYASILEDKSMVLSKLYFVISFTEL